MGVIVTDSGFQSDDWTAPYTALDQLAANDDAVVMAVDVPSEANALDLEGHLDRIDMIRVDFPSFADGRGFSIARTLRRMGFVGRLRATGHVIADQYAMARRSGFDEVEIGADLAARQPEDQWLARADWVAHDYQMRLKA
ncbi:MAG: DUF934 domain-containing protein [Paracoccaceae bacterium]|nr:DUF934 domain-containing protein [Paracoccaceae bacterium]